MRRTPDGKTRASTLFRPVLVAVMVQLLLTTATTAAKLRSGREDTDLYLRYATRTLDGEVPYRDFRIEYPPMALPLFVVPALIAREEVGFKVAFGVEMLAFNAATVAMLAAWVRMRSGSRQVRTALLRYTIHYALLSRLIVTRYDAATMFLAFSAAIAWETGRRRIGGLIAGLGALLKIGPAAVAIVEAPGDLARSPRGRGLLVFASTMAAGMALWLAIGTTKGVVGSLAYQAGRGLEYGSLYSGLQMLAAKATGAGIEIVRDRAAWASVTPWTPRLLPLVLPLQAAAILWVAIVHARRGKAEGVRYSGAAILAFIVAGKVFSPQFLIWLLPFIAALEGPIARWSFGLFAAGIAAMLIVPAMAATFPRDSLVLILAGNLKNGIFLAMLGVLVLGPPSRTSD